MVKARPEIYLACHWDVEQPVNSFVCLGQTYFGMDVSSVNDPVKRQALLTMIRTYGQTPKQLFVHPHSAADASQIAAIPAGQQHEKRTYVVG